MRVQLFIFVLLSWVFLLFIVSLLLSALFPCFFALNSLPFDAYEPSHLTRVTHFRGPRERETTTLWLFRADVRHSRIKLPCTHVHSSLESLGTSFTNSFHQRPPFFLITAFACLPHSHFRATFESPRVLFVQLSVLHLSYTAHEYRSDIQQRLTIPHTFRWNSSLVSTSLR